MANDNLKEAKAAKNNGFYTRYHDIERETNACPEYDENMFRGGKLQGEYGSETIKKKQICRVIMMFP